MSWWFWSLLSWFFRSASASFVDGRRILSLSKGYICIYIYPPRNSHPLPRIFLFPRLDIMLVTSGYTLGEFERTTSNCWSFLVLPPAPPQKKLVVAEAPQFCSFFARKSFSNFAFLGSFGKQRDSRYYKGDLEIILHQAENSWNQVIPKILQYPCSLFNFRNLSTVTLH